MKAFVLTAVGVQEDHFKVDEVAKPTPGPKDLLVKVVTAAFNPVDYAMAAHGFYVPGYPHVLGVDLSGIVEEVGSEVTRFKKGDEIYAFTGAGKVGFGAFAEFSLVQEILAAKKPSNFTFEQAASFSLGAFTAAEAFFNSFKIPLPSEGKQSGFVLVWGGSSSVGSSAVQFASLAGFDVIATSSPHNFEAVKKYGAKHVFDYRAPDVVEQIRKVTDGKLQLVVDAISTGDTPASVLKAVSTDLEVKISHVWPYPDSLPANVKHFPVFGDSDPVFVGKFVVELESIIANNQFVPIDIEVIPNGLSGAYAGIQKIKSVSGKKLVLVL